MSIFETNSDPKRNPSSFTAAFKQSWSYFSCLNIVTQFYSTILYYYLEMLPCFSVYKNMWKTEESQQKSVFHLNKVIPSVNNIWAFLDYKRIIHTRNTVCLQHGLKARIHSRNAAWGLPGCHCKCAGEGAWATAPGLGERACQDFVLFPLTQRCSHASNFCGCNTQIRKMPLQIWLPRYRFCIKAFTFI